MSAPLRTLTIPYSLLRHDNHRFIAMRMGRSARLVYAPGYRAGKTAMATLATTLTSASPLQGPLALVGVLYPPDRRKRDQRNYAKAITDALTGVWYDDDSQLVAELWLKGDVSKDSPRMELTLLCADDVLALARLRAPASPPDADPRPRRTRRTRAA